MDERTFKEQVEAIHMPEDMHQRIKYNLQVHANPTTRKRKYKSLAVAAALALCLCLPLGAAATGLFGHFEDVKNWSGAVVGTKYENATEEISVSAKLSGNGLTVTATLLFPEEPPYRYVEAFSIGSYSIVDANGKILAKGEESAAAVPENAQAQIQLPLDFFPPAGCTLKIDSFIASAKAEQPLPISGNWEIPIQY